MSTTFSSIAGIAVSVIGTASAGFFWLQRIGGRRALQNRWVKVPMIIGALGLIAFVTEAFRVDAVHAGILAARAPGVTALIMGMGLSCFAVGLTVATVAGARQVKRTQLAAGKSEDVNRIDVSGDRLIG